MQRAFLRPIDDGPGHTQSESSSVLKMRRFVRCPKPFWPSMSFDLSDRMVETIPFPRQGQAIMPIQSFEIEAFDLRV